MRSGAAGPEVTARSRQADVGRGITSAIDAAGRRSLLLLFLSRGLLGRDLDALLGSRQRALLGSDEDHEHLLLEDSNRGVRPCRAKWDGHAQDGVTWQH